MTIELQHHQLTRGFLPGRYCEKGPEELHFTTGESQAILHDNAARMPGITG